MTDAAAAHARRAYALIFASAAIILITTGARQTTGLFIQPIMSDTGMSIASVSFALAIGQFVWGATQPFMGALADHYGARRVVILGAALLAVGSVLTAFADSEITLLLTLGVMSAIGASAGSFSILIGGTARSIGPERRSLAAGIINAGGSLGQFVFAPLGQAFLTDYGWQTTLLLLAGSMVAVPLLAAALRGGGRQEGTEGRALPARDAVRQAFGHGSYLLLVAGFFVCGFHVAFITTFLPAHIGAVAGHSHGGMHMAGPGIAAWALALIGLFNIVGSYGSGVLGAQHSKRQLLAGIYLARAVVIAIFITLPPTSTVVLVFAAAMGVLWLSTVPLTSGLVAVMFGTGNLGTLFGLVFLSHQIGAFLGVWLGGLAFEQTGSFLPVWWAGIALAIIAAGLHWPIVERPAPAFAARVGAEG
jgi:predicted MFS family arabinose efflux permease